MPLRLFLLFALVPVAEIYVIIRTGRVLGAWPTVLLLLGMAAAGSLLARHQGLAVLRRIQGEMAQGRLPAGQLLDGALILAGALLLVTPGFLSDLAGVTLLLPPSRRLWKAAMGEWLRRRMADGRLVVLPPR
jgi:UPF0716 protein FxsA